jgi:hypothetical protein
MSEEIKLTDFIKSVSHKKNDLILDSDQPEWTETQYVPFVINKILSKHADSILHANEMNLYSNLPNDAQYRYYLNTLRPRNRYKAKDAEDKQKVSEEDLKMIQRHYSCNRTIAKMHSKVLGKENIEKIREKFETGGKTTK